MRRLGVSLICFYQFLRAVIGLGFGFFIVFYDGPVNKFVSVSSQGNAIEQAVSHFGHAAGLVIIAFAILHMVAGYGLLRMSGWGRALTLLFCAVELALELPTAVGVNAFSLCFGVINATCIIYLATPSVRRAF
jgi:uncharacterized membrane protein (DUF2068 family)